MHITFSIDGDEVYTPEARKSFAAVLHAVADTLAVGAGIPVVVGFRAPEAAPVEPGADGGPIGPSGGLAAPGGVRTPLVTAAKDDPYAEPAEKPAKKAKAKKDETVVKDSKDPAQTSILKEEKEPTNRPEVVSATVPDADALRAIVNKYTNRFGLAKLRETVTAFGVKKLLDLTDAQKIEWAAARTAELAVPAEEEN